MKLEIAMLAGAETKQFLAGLTEQIDRLEKLVAGVPNVSTAQSAPTKAVSAAVPDSDDDFAPKPKMAAKKASAFDDDDAPAQTPASSDDEMDFTTKPEKKEKKKKITVDDVNDACKAKGKAAGRPAVMAILKNFGVESITDLKAEQYAEVIKALA